MFGQRKTKSRRSHTLKVKKPVTRSRLDKVIDIDQAEADIALEENKMFIFSNTKFLPECCPNAYSTGQGCACISDKVRNHIGTRGGNN